MRESHSGRKSFPGGQRSLEDPSPKAKGIPDEVCLTSLEDGKGCCCYLRWGTLKLPTRRKTWTLLSEERN